MMSKMKLRLAGAKLRMVAKLVESGVSGELVRSQVMRQLGVNRVRETTIQGDEHPFALPVRVESVSMAESGVGESGKRTKKSTKQSTKKSKKKSTKKSAKKSTKKGAKKSASTDGKAGRNE